MSELLLEDNVLFCNSRLWKLQEQFFHEFAIHSWVYKVPYQITNNTLIAKRYANVVFTYVIELLEHGLFDLSETFYLFEIGAGAGKFAYHFVYCFEELCHINKMDIDFCYVMSDISKEMVEYYGEHYQLEEYVVRNRIDFARFQLPQDQIFLERKRITLDNACVKNPLVVVANYIFDTLPHMLYQIKKNSLYEAHVSLSTPEENVKDGRVKELEKLNLEFTFDSKLELNKHSSAITNILQEYAQQMKNATFFLPTGAFKLIDDFKQRFEREILFIVNDKGHNLLNDVDVQKFDKVIFHGSFSVAVNFDAVARYVAFNGGSYLLDDFDGGIRHNMFLLNGDLHHYPRVTYAMNQLLEEVTANDAISLRKLSLRHADTFTLKEFIALLKLGCFDQNVYFSMHEVFLEYVKKSKKHFTASQRLTILRALEEVAKQYYHIPNGKDIYYHIVMIYYELGSFDQVNAFTIRSFYNSGMYLYYTKQYEQAIGFFEKLLEYDPFNADAKKMLRIVSKKM